MSGYYIGAMYVSPEIYHHGVVGQKWGQRRYQNEDGSLTALGREHYGYSMRSMQNRLNALDKELAYNRGDTSRSYLKENTYHNDFKRLSSKGKVAQAYKASKKLGKARKEIEFNEKEREKIKKQIDDILKMAGDQGYSVIKKPTNRWAIRTGERFARYFGAATMAAVTSAFLPIGFGTTGEMEYTRGTRYKLREKR